MRVDTQTEVDVGKGKKSVLLSFNSDSGTSKKMRLVVDSTDVEMANDATA